MSALDLALVEARLVEGQRFAVSLGGETNSSAAHRRFAAGIGAPRRGVELARPERLLGDLEKESCHERAVTHVVVAFAALLG